MLCWKSPLMTRKSILIVFVWKISVRLVKDVCVGGNSSEKYSFLDLYVLINYLHICFGK